MDNINDDGVHAEFHELLKIMEERTKKMQFKSILLERHNNNYYITTKMYIIMKYWAEYIYPCIKQSECKYPYYHKDSNLWLYEQGFSINDDYDDSLTKSKKRIHSDDAFWKYFKINATIRNNIIWNDKWYWGIAQFKQFRNHSEMISLLIELRRKLYKVCFKQVQLFPHKMDMIYFVNVTIQWTMCKMYIKKQINNRIRQYLLPILPKVLTNIITEYN